MNWLGNVKAPPVEIKRSLPVSYVEQLESMLAFVQETQPGATIDHLMEFVLEAFVKKDEDFEVPQESKQISFGVPPDLKAKLDARVQAMQELHPKANERHLLEHAIKSYTSGQTKLAKAWRAAKKQAFQESEPQPTSEALVLEVGLEQTPSEETVSRPLVDTEALLARARQGAQDRQARESHTESTSTDM